MSAFATEALGLLLSPRARASRLTGAVLGSWRLDERLPDGEGGFGVVYRASHKHLGVGAVKVFGFDLSSDASWRTAFEREVEMLKRITDCDEAHRLVRIYDAGVYEDSLPWLAMKFVPGKSLGRHIHDRHAARRSIPPSHVVTILSDVLQALQGLNAAFNQERGANKVVHRDIKPANVIVHEELGQMRAWLIDFGIARIFNAPTSAVEAGSPANQTTMPNAFTPEYGSPEMWIGRHQAIDARSDIFQVGLLGYEMMTGQRYWDAWPDVEAVFAASPYPRALKRAVAKALDWNRARRFSGSQGFVTHLRRPHREMLLRHRGQFAGLLVATMIFLGLAWLRWGRPLGALNRAFAWQTDTLKTQGKLIDDEQSEIVRLRTILKEESPVMLQARLRDISRLCKKLTDASASLEEVNDLRSQCNAFVLVAPNHWRRQEVERLRDWIDAALAGKVQITVMQFNESKYLGHDWNMAYSINALPASPQQVTRSGARFVTGKVDVGESLDIPWTPKGEVEVIVESRNKGYTGSERLALEADVILRGESPSQWREVKTREDGSFKLWYTVQRIGFGPLPPFLE